jgi:hypothetical protein
LRQDVTDIAEVHPAVSRHEWIFFRESIDDFDIAFQKLLEAISLDLDRIHTHTRLLVRESEWNNKQRKSSFLLRGEELEEAEKWLTESLVKPPTPTDRQVIYIENSRKVEDENQREIQIFQAAIKKAEKQKRIGLVILVMSLVFVLGIFILQEKYRSTELRENYRPINNPKQQQNGKGLIYIQVPSQSIKERIKNLPLDLTNNGYKAPNIEVVGLSPSPNNAQIRYFFNDEKTKANALELQKKLNELGYKEFDPKEVKYIKGYEKKVTPEMMEIWFPKDTK